MVNANPSPDAELAARGADALTALVEAARLAGQIALRDFRLGEPTAARVGYKHGGSPVTEADMAVDRFLKARLGAIFPHAGWLSEETADDEARLALGELVVVDPIDGTRAFLSGDARWTVSIAFVVGHRPIAGVVHAPALGETFAASTGAGATLNGVPVRASDRQDLNGARVGGPRQLVSATSAAAGVAFETEPKIPSLAYRLARVANGSLDAALASANSHDWDVAGADILLEEAGAGLRDAEGRPLRYNARTTRRDSLAAAPCALLPSLTSALGRAVGIVRA